MITKRLSLSPQHREESINIAADILKRGGIVALPTETVYGLAASAYCDSAIKNVFAAKGRPQDNPLIVHISDMDMLYELASDVPQAAVTLAEKFWPGPLSIVLKRTNKVCESVCAGLDTVAIRMPADDTCRDLIRRAGIPFAAPSANISGYPSPTTANHVIADMDGKIDAVLMGDDCAVGVESTVVALFGEKPRLLRPGGITAEQLKSVLKNLEIDNAVLSEPEKGVRVASPGMKYKHYSPKTPVYLVKGSSAAFADFVNTKTGAVAVCFKEDSGITLPYMVYGSVNEPETLAHSVFGVLRELDNTSYTAAFIHAPETDGVGLAVYNRLLRAAAFRVISL